MQSLQKLSDAGEKVPLDLFCVHLVEPLPEGHQPHPDLAFPAAVSEASHGSLIGCALATLTYFGTSVSLVSCVLLLWMLRV